MMNNKHRKFPFVCSGLGCWVNPEVVAQQLRESGQELVSKHKPDIDEELMKVIQKEFDNSYNR